MTGVLRRTSEIVRHQRRRRVADVLEAAGQPLGAAAIEARVGYSTARTIGALRVIEARGEVRRDAIRQDRRGARWEITEGARRFSRGKGA